MLSVSYAGKNPYSADKTNGLLKVDAFLINTDTCWSTVGGTPLLQSIFVFFLQKELSLYGGKTFKCKIVQLEAQECWMDGWMLDGWMV